LKILLLEGLNWCPIFGGINFRPKIFTIRVQARLIGIDPFPAFLLMVTLPFAEDACHLVPVGVVPQIGSSLLLVIGVVAIIALRPEIWS
jgi:hypothetical protein